MKLERGAVVLVRFPFTDLSGSKRRPAVVLASYPPDMVVAFISSVIPSVPELSDVVLQPSVPAFASTGLKVTSVIRLRKLATLEQTLITRLLGQLNQELLTAVDKALLTGLRIGVSSQFQAEYQHLFELWHEQGETAVYSYLQERQ